MRCAVALLALVAGLACAEPPEVLLGTPTQQLVKAGDTLLDIAHRHDVGYVAMLAANPGVDPWLPREGTLLQLPTQHLLPDGPREGLLINLAELRLYWFAADGSAPRTFPLGIGDEGKETPLGETRVRATAADPIWTPTASERAEDPTLPPRVLSLIHI